MAPLLSRTRLPPGPASIAARRGSTARPRSPSSTASRLGRRPEVPHLFDVMWLDRDVMGPAARRPPRAARRLSRSTRAPRIPRGAGSTTLYPGIAPEREGWEGVIAKRRGTPHEQRRSPHWLKMKCEAPPRLRGSASFTDPQGRLAKGLGALLVGYFEGDELIFAGKLGTGFDTAMLLGLRAPPRRPGYPRPPLHQGGRAPAPPTPHWVRPELVVPRRFHRVDKAATSSATRGSSLCARTRPRARWCAASGR